MRCNAYRILDKSKLSKVSMRLIRLYSGSIAQRPFLRPTYNHPLIPFTHFTPLKHQYATKTNKMGKSDDQVVEEFNEYVNMSASDLEKWLKTEESESSGWGDQQGESVGHESGRKITDILKRNPKKDPSKYTDEDKEHMRKVASYCKRHLAQESKLKDSKSKEELQQTKAYRSLKNWGHDLLA